MKVKSRSDRDAAQIGAGRLLGFAGLIPFWALPVIELASVYFTPEFIAGAEWAVLTYGVVIVSFMGGCRWSFRVIDPQAGGGAPFAGFLGAVTPALVAWLLIAVPETVGDRSIGLWPRFLVVAGLLLFQLTQDAAHRREGGPLPNWYWKLRTALASGAAGGILVGALAATAA